ncbi:uncharacterized protein TRAVEDRAFT_74419 [Trametes versicolor FP-101664 SS1]|uniref:uncharacterized protein n=1 Tax=Trametes versicolor (strain FP-101664) TaxID=717944 RepID=UPI000462182C|nr:uncharacterized protein TRAVEDRAFT_74419 [Trametes versicolor FP-101664 SS1]EIW54208.1 hypothetical protein TRAVEDRAFT_74419 [Trametes versicolor FP-101664 SS1]
MGPSRKAGVSDPSSSKPSTSTPQKNNSKRPQHKKHPAPPEASNALPGVQKIKAALRQTRRLLAKDNLAADKRVATERRLKSLEGDLEKAEQGRLERAMATRYHKIKFFERQKVSRKVQQTKRKLAAATEKGERKEWEARLAELRVDLSYIVYYPKTKKYISLFPPEVRNAKEGQSAADAAREAKEKSETDRQREEIRAWMREQMDSGALSSEPEVELEKSEKRSGSASKVAPTMEVQETKKSKVKNDQKGVSTAKGAKASGVANDDFFGADGGEDEGSSSGGGESDGDIDMDED